MKRRCFLKDCALIGATSVACSMGLLTTGLAFAKVTEPFQATSVDAVLAELGVNSPKVSDQIKGSSTFHVDLSIEPAGLAIM